MGSVATHLKALKGLAALARELREAGVVRVKTGDLELELRPAEYVPAPGELAEMPESTPGVHPLDDPDTFPGGRMPRLPRGDE